MTDLEEQVKKISGHIGSALAASSEMDRIILRGYQGHRQECLANIEKYRGKVGVCFWEAALKECEEKIAEYSGRI